MQYQRYDRLHRRILAPANLAAACTAVIRKGGAPGADNMPLDQLAPWLKAHKDEFCEAIKNGAWRPSPLRKGRHLLLVPTALDRLVFQAFFQVLLPIFEQDFSPFAFGYRPERGRDQEAAQARRYQEAGYAVVLRPFIDRFIDEVDHGILLRQTGKRIKDEQVLVMLERILGNTLITEDRAVPLCRGIRQCGSLSFLLGTLHLSGCDQDLEAAGLRFTRFGDRYALYVKNRAEADAAQERVGEYLEGKLRLRYRPFFFQRM